VAATTPEAKGRLLVVCLDMAQLLALVALTFIPVYHYCHTAKTLQSKNILRYFVLGKVIRNLMRNLNSNFGSR
jgi:hypothetical protein